MPLYVGKYRTLAVDFTPFATIPLVYLYDLSHLYRQIIDENLYTTLLNSDITWTLLSTGDFLIKQSVAIDELQDEIDVYRGDPPTPHCKGRTILTTTYLSKSESQTSSIIATSETEKIIVCLGRTTVTTFIDSILHEPNSSITADSDTEII
jgi:hypothetical protein